MCTFTVRHVTFHVQRTEIRLTFWIPRCLDNDVKTLRCGNVLGQLFRLAVLTAFYLQTCQVLFDEKPNFLLIAGMLDAEKWASIPADGAFDCRSAEAITCQSGSMPSIQQLYCICFVQTRRCSASCGKQMKRGEAMCCRGPLNQNVKMFWFHPFGSSSLKAGSRRLQAMPRLLCAATVGWCHGFTAWDVLRTMLLLFYEQYVISGY